MAKIRADKEVGGVPSSSLNLILKSFLESQQAVIKE
jgi:hypothetical protein